jgi:hypothetical protein
MVQKENEVVRESIVFNEEDLRSITWEEGVYEEDELGDIIQTYKQVFRKQTYNDLEKAYYLDDVVLERLSDGKFFKGSVMVSYNHDNLNVTFKEVFPKTKTITVYE